MLFEDVILCVFYIEFVVYMKWKLLVNVRLEGRLWYYVVEMIYLVILIVVICNKLMYVNYILLMCCGWIVGIFFYNVVKERNRKVVCFFFENGVFFVLDMIDGCFNLFFYYCFGL